MNELQGEYVKMVLELSRLVKNKQWDIVESYARTIVQKFPTSIYTLKRLAISLVKQKKLSEATTYYEQAVAVGRQHHTGHVEYVKQLDVLYRQLGRYDDALRICTYYLELQHNSDEAINRYNRSAKLAGRDDLVLSPIVKPQVKRVPLGKPLELTDDQLDELSQVTPGDIEKARRLWNDSVPNKYRGLLDAQLIKKSNRSKRKK